MNESLIIGFLKIQWSRTQFPWKLKMKLIWKIVEDLHVTYNIGNSIVTYQTCIKIMIFIKIIFNTEKKYRQGCCYSAIGTSNLHIWLFCKKNPYETVYTYFATLDRLPIFYISIGSTTNGSTSISSRACWLLTFQLFIVILKNPQRVQHLPFFYSPSII